MSSDNLAVIVVNRKQRRLLCALEDLHLIKIEGSNDLKLTLSDRAVCTFAYISGPKFICNKVYDLFESGFLVSKDGQDRRDYKWTKEFIEKGKKRLEDEDGRI